MRNSNRLCVVLLAAMFLGMVLGNMVQIDMLDFWTDNSTPGFNFTAISDVNETFVCELMVDGIGSGKNSSVFNNTPTRIFSNRTLSEGQRNWTVSCTDFDGEYNESGQVFIDFSSPEAVLFFPENNTWINTSIPTVNFSSTDNLDPETNHTIFVNDIEMAKKPCQNNSFCNVTLSSLDDGQHNFTLVSRDRVGNTENISIFFWINTHPPFGMELISPEDLANTDNFVNFSFICSDDMDYYLNYSFYLKNYSSGVEEIEKTGTTQGNNSVTNFSFTVPPGDFQWRIKVVDGAGNYLFSGYRFLEVNDTLPPTSAPVLLGVNDTNMDGNIEINWSADQNATYYRLYRSSQEIAGAENLTYHAETNQTFFLDTMALHGSTYWYALTSLDAIKNENKSIVSNSFNIIVNDTILPFPVLNISSPDQEDGSILLNWLGEQKDIQNNTDFVEYWVFRTTNDSTPNLTLTQDRIAVTQEKYFKDTTVTTGNNYSYFVISVDDAVNKNMNLSSNNTINKTAQPCQTSFTKSAWSDCVNGFRHRTLERTCYGGGDDHILQSEPCTPPPEGGAITPPLNETQEEVEQPPTTIIKIETNGVEIIWDRLGSQMNIDIEQEKFPVVSISFRSTRQKSQGPRISIRVQSNLTNSIGRKVYHYLSMESTYLSTSEIDGDISIRYKVPSSWLSENNLTSNRISFYRFSDGWGELPTRILGYDGTHYHYESMIPGFSYFAIAEKESEGTISIDFPQSYYQAHETGLSAWQVFFVFIMLFSIVLGYYVFQIRKNQDYW